MRVPTEPTTETSTREASQTVPTTGRPARKPRSTALATTSPESVAGRASGTDHATSAMVGRPRSDRRAYRSPPRPHESPIGAPGGPPVSTLPAGGDTRGPQAWVVRSPTG